MPTSHGHESTQAAEEHEAALQRSRAMMGIIDNAHGIADVEIQVGPGLGEMLADLMVGGTKKKKDDGKGKKMVWVKKTKVGETKGVTGAKKAIGAETKVRGGSKDKK